MKESMGALARGNRAAKASPPAHSRGHGRRPPLWARARPLAVHSHGPWGSHDGLDTATEDGRQGAPEWRPLGDHALPKGGGWSSVPLTERAEQKAARVTHLAGCRIHPPRSASSYLTFRVILQWRCCNSYSCFPDEDWGLRKVTSTQNHVRLSNRVRVCSLSPYQVSEVGGGLSFIR